MMMPARIATKMPAFTLDAEAPERNIWSMPSFGALALAATGSDWFFCESKIVSTTRKFTPYMPM